MNEEQYKVKVIIINRVVDAYFASKSKSMDLAMRFMDWMDNGELEEEKNAALYRKFEEICDKEFNRSGDKSTPGRDRRYPRNNGNNARIWYN